MSEETIGGLIMLGLWVSFMAAIIVINKRKISKGFEVEPLKPSHPTGLNIPVGTFDFNAVPRVDNDGKYRDN